MLLMLLREQWDINKDDMILSTSGQVPLHTCALSLSTKATEPQRYASLLACIGPSFNNTNNIKKHKHYEEPPPTLQEMR